MSILCSHRPNQFVFKKPGALHGDKMLLSVGRSLTSRIFAPEFDFCDSTNQLVWGANIYHIELIPGSAIVVTAASPTHTVAVAGSFKKFHYRNVQCAGELLDTVDRRIACATLQIRNVSPMQPRSLCEFPLRNPQNGSFAPDCRAQSTPQV
jgi:hypothetical protein